MIRLWTKRAGRSEVCVGPSNGRTKPSVTPRWLPFPKNIACGFVSPPRWNSQADEGPPFPRDAQSRGNGDAIRTKRPERATLSARTNCGVVVICTFSAIEKCAGHALMGRQQVALGSCRMHGAKSRLCHFEYALAMKSGFGRPSESNCYCVRRVPPTRLLPFAEECANARKDRWTSTAEDTLVVRKFRQAAGRQRPDGESIEQLRSSHYPGAFRPPRRWWSSGWSLVETQRPFLVLRRAPGPGSMPSLAASGFSSAM